MSSYLTDNATRDPKDDALNFGDFRPVLKEILTNAETPLTVGIFGAWGSGKTSLMRMLRDEIDADNKIEGDNDSESGEDIEGGDDSEGEKKASARTVWFTAWKYDRQEALWRALILRVLEAMYPREDGDGPREERPILSNPGDNNSN